MEHISGAWLQPSKQISQHYYLHFYVFIVVVKVEAIFTNTVAQINYNSQLFNT